MPNSPKNWRQCLLVKAQVQAVILNHEVEQSHKKKVFGLNGLMVYVDSLYIYSTCQFKKTYKIRHEKQYIGRILIYEKLILKWVIDNNDINRIIELVNKKINGNKG